MPQRRRTRAIPLSDGFALGNLEEPLPSAELYRQNANAPGSRHLLSLANVARELDFDTTKPDIAERIFRAARDRFVAEHPSAADRVREHSVWIPPRPVGRHDQVVYYMRMSDLVKIGTTVDIRRRLEELSPQGVLAVEFGDYALERLRHHQFVDQHSHGEWFRLDELIIDHIVTVRAQFEAETGRTTEEWVEAPR